MKKCSRKPPPFSNTFWVFLTFLEKLLHSFVLCLISYKFYRFSDANIATPHLQSYRFVKCPPKSFLCLVIQYWRVLIQRALNQSVLSDWSWKNAPENPRPLLTLCGNFLHFLDSFLVIWSVSISYKILFLPSKGKGLIPSIPKYQLTTPRRGGGDIEWHWPYCTHIRLLKFNVFLFFSKTQKTWGGGFAHRGSKRQFLWNRMSDWPQIRL